MNRLQAPLTVSQEGSLCPPQPGDAFPAQPLALWIAQNSFEHYQQHIPALEAFQARGAQRSTG